MLPDLSRFFEPVHIHDIILPNRFVMPAMQRGMMQDGGPSAELTGIFVRRARAGLGLVIAEATYIDHPSARWQPHSARMEERTAPAWGHCIDEVHRAGGFMFVQLAHPGAVRSNSDGSPMADSLSPSGLISPDKPNGRPMTAHEMGEIAQAFVTAALLAQRLGADGVEIHCAHGYLLDQFLWARTNCRTDGYGGDDIRDRLRFPAEVVAAVRAAVGLRFPISVRLSQFKEIDYDARVADTAEELRTLVTALRNAGADIFHMSTRRFYHPAFAGSARSLSGWVKSFTDAVVIAVGSVGLDNDVFSQMLDNAQAHSSIAHDLERLAASIAAEEFDMIAIGRGLIADEQWVHKVRTGKIDAITPFTKPLLGGYIEKRDAGPVEVARGTDLTDGLPVDRPIEH